MCKSSYLIVITIFFSCSTNKLVDTSEPNSYLLFSNVDSKFNYADSKSYVHYKDSKKTESLNDKIYSITEIIYSWGHQDKAYYRLDKGNVMYYDMKSDSETLIMPKDPKIGMMWKSQDGAWEYEIIDLDAKIETPVNMYSGLLAMKARQLLGRDVNKLAEYINYYEKGKGKIASFGNGKLMTYRVE